MRNDLSKTIEADFGIKPWQAFSIRHYLFKANPNIFMFDESGDLFQQDVDKEWHKINYRSASIIICQVMPESLLQILFINKPNTKKGNIKMKALKCDVCGNLYEYGQKNGYAKIGTYNRDYDGRLYDCKSYDLCPECFKKVKQVLRINDESEGKTV